MLPSPLGAGEPGGGGEVGGPEAGTLAATRTESPVWPGPSGWKLASPDPPGLRDLWGRSQPLRHPPGPRLRDPSRAHQPLDPVFLLEPRPPPQGLSVKACSPPRALTPGPLTRGRNRINVCMDFRSRGVWWCSWCLVRLHTQLPPGSGLPPNWGSGNGTLFIFPKTISCSPPARHVSGPLGALRWWRW